MLLLIEPFENSREDSQGSENDESLLENLLGKITPEEQARTDRKMKIAAIIAEAIVSKGWSKRQFADIIRKKPSEITKWLSGTHNFTIDTLTDIERILEIELLPTEKTATRRFMRRPIGKGKIVV